MVMWPPLLNSGTQGQYLSPISETYAGSTDVTQLEETVHPCSKSPFQDAEHSQARGCNPGICTPLKTRAGAGGRDKKADRDAPSSVSKGTHC